jgi:tetratricopeptide (TPR) repeat protein
VIQLEPTHISARTYLAMVHERIGHTSQAISEYLAVASLQQQVGESNKAADMVKRALKVDPGSPEARQAENLLRNGRPLPKPFRSLGNTDTLRTDHARMEISSSVTESGLDPITEANKKAITHLAELVFNLSDDGEEIRSLRGGSMSAILRGKSPLENRRPARLSTLLHINQAIGDQTSGQEENAIGELEKAISTGFKDQAAYFNLGYLLIKSGKGEKALRSLQYSVKNAAYKLAARLLMGQVKRSLDRLPEAAVEYMEALRAADSLSVPDDQAAELHQAYEPYLEAVSKAKKSVEMERICNNIQNLLIQPNWRTHILQAREQLPDEVEGMPPHPLVEVLVQVQNSQVIDALTRVRELAKQNHPRAAMEEAYAAIKEAPLYLPLHSLIGDILNQQGHTQDAVTKYNMVAAAYGVRGEASQAVAYLRRVVKTNPMDMAARTHLIDQLITQGLVDEAISEYLDLGDIQYRLAELDLARSTYATAQQHAAQGSSRRAWSIKLLQRMADLDMQRLDWKQALQVNQQIRSLQPEDCATRKDVILLEFRLGKQQEALDEMENYLGLLKSSGRDSEAIPFIAELVKEEPAQAVLHSLLVEHYHRAGRLKEAEAELNEAGKLLLDSGDRQGALHAIESIIAMNPAAREMYTPLLDKLR